MRLPLETFVSERTLEKFKVYERLLREWNRRTALVQQDTLADFDNRHILDSLQLIPIMETLSSSLPLSPAPLNEAEILLPETWENLDKSTPLKATIALMDVGTGAGFPGMVLAMCGFKGVSLCESNQKKCFFLEEIGRQTDTPVTIINERVENVKEKYDVMLSRACTELTNLTDIMNKVLLPTGYGLFHKGRSWKNELMSAQHTWNFKSKAYKSVTSEDSVLLYLHHLQKNNAS